MKTLNYMVSSVAVAFGLVVSADALPAPQRAAANHFETRRPSMASAPQTTTGADGYVAGGKAAAHFLDLRKPAPAGTGIDIVHAPRPITASKDPDLEQKWRANAKKFQVAPVK